MGSPEDGAYPPKIRLHAIRPKKLGVPAPAAADGGGAIIWRPVERLIRVAYTRRASTLTFTAATPPKPGNWS